MKKNDNTVAVYYFRVSPPKKELFFIILTLTCTRADIILYSTSESYIYHLCTFTYILYTLFYGLFFTSMPIIASYIIILLLCSSILVYWFIANLYRSICTKKKKRYVCTVVFRVHCVIVEVCTVRKNNEDTSQTHTHTHAQTHTHTHGQTHSHTNRGERKYEKVRDGEGEEKKRLLG